MRASAALLVLARRRVSPSRVAAVRDRVIDVRRPRESYGGVERLHGISFSVERGEIFGFRGTIGAGKTTTIEIVEGTGPATPDSFRPTVPFG